jgi:hypothetical protein
VAQRSRPPHPVRPSSPESGASSAVPGDALAHEAQRQALLLRTLWRRSPDAVLAGWLRDAPARAARGLSAYRSNGAALAARSLAAAFPTVAQLVGEDSFEALAAAFWHAHPPVRGDLAQHGATLPAFIAADAQLADVPWLADSARLDWAVHRAEASADAEEPPAGLERLGTDDPDTLCLCLRPGVALVASRWPVATLWQAHRSTADDRFQAVREALAEGRGEAALVWREGWRAQVAPLPAADAAFTQALLAGQPLLPALDAAGADFAFEPWLLDALRHGRLAAVQTHRQLHGADVSHGDAQ